MEDAAGSAPRHSRDDELKFVQTLYARAQSELKISELLKRLDDEKIAAIPMPDATLPAANDATSKDEGGATEQKKPSNIDVSLPHELEAVLVRWEALVLGALERDPRGE